MSFTSKGTSEILVAGEQDKMLVIDTVKGEVTKLVSLARSWRGCRSHHVAITRRDSRPYVHRRALRLIVALGADGTQV